MPLVILGNWFDIKYLEFGANCVHTIPKRKGGREGPIVLRRREAERALLSSCPKAGEWLRGGLFAVRYIPRLRIQDYRIFCAFAQGKLLQNSSALCLLNIGMPEFQAFVPSEHSNAGNSVHSNAGDSRGLRS